MTEQRTRKQAYRTDDTRSWHVYVSRNFVMRLVTTLIFVPLSLSVLLIGEPVFTIATVIFTVNVLLELLCMTNYGHLRWSMVVCAGLGVAIVIGLPAGYHAIWLGAIILCGAVVLVLERRRRDQALRMLAWAIVVALIASCAIVIRAHQAGLLLWLLILNATWGTDIMAYAGGRAYGRRPLAPGLSPNKTVEGALTGLIVSSIIGLSGLIWFNLLTSLTITLVIGAPFAALIGDLIESKIKRIYGVKDSRIGDFSIVPGHGGLLDRVDSLLAVLVYFVLVIAIFSVIQM